MIQIIGQSIGFVALVVSVFVFQKNKRKSMLLLQMVASFIFMVHYLLLGAITGATMNFINTFRNYIFSQKERWHWASSSFWLYFFISVFIISGLITWQGYISILPIIGMVIGTISFWMNDPRRIRLFSLVSPPLWFIYNFISHSYPGMIVEIINITSIIIGIIRFDIIKKDEKLIIN